MSEVHLRFNKEFLQVLAGNHPDQEWRLADNQMTAKQGTWQGRMARQIRTYFNPDGRVQKNREYHGRPSGDHEFLPESFLKDHPDRGPRDTLDLRVDLWVPLDQLDQLQPQYEIHPTIETRPPG